MRLNIALFVGALLCACKSTAPAPDAGAADHAAAETIDPGPMDLPSMIEAGRFDVVQDGIAERLLATRASAYGFEGDDIMFRISEPMKTVAVLYEIDLFNCEAGRHEQLLAFSAKNASLPEGYTAVALGPTLRGTGIADPAAVVTVTDGKRVLETRDIDLETEWPEGTIFAIECDRMK